MPWGESLACFVRASDRFFVVAHLMLAVLAGYGLARLESVSRYASGIDRWAALIMASLVVFEFLYLPYPMLRPAVPEFYARLEEEEGEFAILDLPMGRGREDMYYQTFH